MRTKQESESKWERGFEGMTKVLISVRKVSIPAELNDGPTATQILKSLPIRGTAQRWGEEIYFEIPVTAEQESGARAEVDVGELGYWPVGRAFCIFFGPTPASTDERPRAYSPVNILGRVSGDAKGFGSVEDGEEVRITLVEG
jgi:hypothetical protein